MNYQGHPMLCFLSLYAQWRVTRARVIGFQTALVLETICVELYKRF